MGPDNVPYVIDQSTKAVYRVDPKAKKATTVLRSGQKAGGATIATPRFLAVGGLDLLILDAKNQLWRWRPADADGAGTLVRVPVEGAASWGDDVTGINSFLRDRSRNLYNLYVIDPSEQQIRSYSASADGGGFPLKSSNWLATERDVSGITSTYVDGDMFAVDGGGLERFVSGKTEGWEPSAPKDTLLRPEPTYTLVTSAGDRRTGQIYAFDTNSDRVIAFDKLNGTYRSQYRLAGGVKDWSDLQAMAIFPGAEDEPPALIWMSHDAIHRSVLTEVPDVPPVATPTPSASPSASAAPAKATPKPTKKPAKKPTRKP
jgi:hypothetical protein